MDIESSSDFVELDLNQCLQEEEVVTINENTEGKISEPQIGMQFDCVNDILEYYKKYGNEVGFPVKKRNSKKGDDGVVNWISIACGREGKTQSKCKNSFKMQPICKTNCGAKINVGESERQAKFIATFEPGNSDIKCNCRLFEFRGIICRHCLTILINVKKLHSLPQKYILRRWRKDVKRCHTKVKVTYSNWTMNPENERGDKLCKMFYEVVDLATENEDKTKFVANNIKWLFKQLKNDEWTCISSGPRALSVTRPSSASNGVKDNLTLGGNVVPRSPLSVRRKGRPLSNRKQGIVEKAIRRKRQKMSQVSSQSTSTKLVNCFNMTSEASLPIAQDIGSISQVSDFALDTSNVYCEMTNPREEACLNGVDGIINYSSNQQGNNDALWDLSGKYFDPFWTPTDDY